ncbi:hypothetical protein V1477_000978 [Vespula maculifrons]|uniref:Uncharacterized protein n=1 Tax=Vespula maculifrons TaxID=7453 RepID=A0ABD2D0G8_VESMC
MGLISGLLSMVQTTCNPWDLWKHTGNGTETRSTPYSKEIRNFTISIAAYHISRTQTTGSRNTDYGTRNPVATEINLRQNPDI